MFVVTTTLCLWVSCMESVPHILFLCSSLISPALEKKLHKYSFFSDFSIEGILNQARSCITVKQNGSSRPYEKKNELNCHFFFVDRADLQHLYYQFSGFFWKVPYHLLDWWTSIFVWFREIREIGSWRWKRPVQNTGNKILGANCLCLCWADTFDHMHT